MEFNSEKLIQKNSYFDQSNSANISKELNGNENDNDNELENEEDIPTNLIYSWGFSKYGQTSIENVNYLLTPTIINFTQILNSSQIPQNMEIEPFTGESHSAFLFKDQDSTYI